MKLELKHLAPYLPYGLTWFCLDQDSREFEQLPTVKVVDLANEVLEVGGMEVDISELPYPNGLTIKPILLPLSDIFKTIKCQDLTYLDDLSQSGASHFDDQLIRDIEITPSAEEIRLLSYDCLQVLFKNHFDLFGLIDKGLAIDINTLH